MTKIVIRSLIWNEWTIEHIKKHSVTIKEIQEIINYFKTHVKGHSGRYLMIGRSGTRIISVVVRRVKTSVYQVVTARDSNKIERSRLYEKEKK
jgi:uncharacterized DUF497 family protein